MYSIHVLFLCHTTAGMILGERIRQLRAEIIDSYHVLYRDMIVVSEVRSIMVNWGQI